MDAKTFPRSLSKSLRRPSCVTSFQIFSNAGIARTAARNGFESTFDRSDGRSVTSSRLVTSAGGVRVYQNFVGVVFEDVPVKPLAQLLLHLRPFDDLTGLFDPIERDGLDCNGVHNDESTKPYDYGVEGGVVLDESRE